MISVRPYLIALLTLLAAASLRSGEPEKAGPIRVTIVVVFASTEKKEIDKKLADLAKEVQKENKELIGFSIAETHQDSIGIGSSQSFKLPEDQKVKVTIDKPKDANEKVGLTVELPGGGTVAYKCSCGTFFPMLTTYKNKAGEKLIVAVLAKPCTGKGP